MKTPRHHSSWNDGEKDKKGIFERDEMKIHHLQTLAFNKNAHASQQQL
jgi:hypothetical protein